MSSVPTGLINELLGLPALDRAQIVDELLGSLDKPDPAIDALWIKEAERRLRAYDAGEGKSLSEEEFFADDEGPA